MRADDRALERMLENTYTKADLYRRIDLVQEFLVQSLFNREHHQGSRAKDFRVWGKSKCENMEDAEAVSAASTWGDDVLNSFTPENVYVRIKELKQAIEALPEIVLYVPAVFSVEHVASLGTWCRAHVRAHILLQFIVEPTVAGGCAFVIDNVYHNFSLSYFMRKSHKELIELVRTYGTT